MWNSTLSPIAIPYHLHSFPPFIPCNPFSPPPLGGNTGDLLSYFPGLGHPLLAGGIRSRPETGKGRMRLYARNSIRLPGATPGRSELGAPQSQTESTALRGECGILRRPHRKKLYRTVKRNPLLLKSGLVYTPQVVPAHDPGRRVAPSMRQHCPSRALNEDYPKATGLAPRKDGGMRRREPEKAMGDM